MNFKASAGSIFLTPIEKIPSVKTEVGFSGKTDKNKPEVPYKFKVTGVGGPIPINGVLFYTDVKIGDIVSVNQKNQTLRENIDVWGFMIDDLWYYAIDFQDILGFWETDEERQQKINEELDRLSTGLLPKTPRVRNTV